MNKFEEERKQFPAALTQCYLDTGATGLVPQYAYDAVKKYQDGRLMIGGDADWGGYGTVEMLRRSRTAVAEMLGCAAEDICFGSNTSEMMRILVEGLQLQPGDNVLISDEAFFGQKYVWHFQEVKDVEIRKITPVCGVVDTALIEKYADEHTRVVSLDLVENSTGYRIDAEKIGAWCHEHGIIFAADAAQAAGAVQIDVKKMCIDFLAGNDYKWMMGFGGTGYAYVSEKLRRDLVQRSAGWMADRDLFTEKDHLELAESASRYEYGYPNVAGIRSLGLVAERYNTLGREEIETYILSLNRYLEDKLEAVPEVTFWSDYPQKNRSGIIILTFGKDCRITDDCLKKAGIAAHIRDGRMYGAERAMRIAVHYYNSKEDMDRLVQVLGECCR